jgi:hypothetical protein
MFGHVPCNKLFFKISVPFSVSLAHPSSMVSHSDRDVAAATSGLLQV